jgi:Fe-S oxidoreductase
MTWQTPVFLLVAAFAFGYSGKKFLSLIKLMKAHQGKDARSGELFARIKTTLVNVLGQRAVLQSRVPGIMHAMIFWGFMIITIGTLEQFASTIYSGFHFDFVGEPLYRAYVFLHDVFTLLVCLAVGYFFYRRLIIRPAHLQLSKDAIFVLSFTLSLMLSIFVMHGFLILGDNPWYRDSLPVSNFLATHVFSAFNLSEPTYQVLGVTFKWVHMLLVLGFSMYIPNSKHLHIVAAGPNTFLRKLDRAKGMKPINFEDEKVTQYGAGKITDLSWKDALDYYACTECGRCQALCPAWNTEKPLSPKNLITDLKHNLYDNKDRILSGKLDEVSPVIDSHVTEDVIWACTSCRACEIACPVFIEHTDKIYDVRRNLVLMESKFPTEVQTIFKNMESNATPWAFSSADRDKWAEGLGINTVSQGQPFDVLLWVGCAGSFDDRNKKVIRSFVSVLKKAGINFAILGNEEQCTGDPARRIGNEFLYQTLAKANIETLNRYNVKQIVTACPHCFNTIKNEYKDFGGQYEVVHHSQYLAKLISDGKIKPTKSMEETVTFHDSCYLGRWNGIYDQPRSVLGAVPATRMVEMKWNHDQSMCCGAGGGRMFMEESIGRKVNITRTEMALETRASVVAASCPFCMTMLTDGLKAKEMHDKVRVLDIAEVIDQSTPGN